MDERLFVIVPAFNEARSIGGVVTSLRARYARVVVVDDGSSDATSEAARTAGAAVLRHIVNRGQGAALQTGMAYALSKGAEVIVTFDADGQHNVDDVEKLIAPIREGRADIALGSRLLEHSSDVPWFRRLVLRAGVLFTWIVSGIRLTDSHNGLRAISRKAAEQIDLREDRMAHASELLDIVARRKLRHIEVPVRILYSDYSKAKGQSSWAAFRIAFDVLVSRVGKSR